MTWQQIGLLSFVLTTFVTVAVLVYDLHLYLTNQEMITTYCRNHPWAAWIILSLDSLGLFGLAIHFMRPVELLP